MTIITPSDLRAQFETDLTDAAVQVVLDDIDARIIALCGAVDAQTDQLEGGGRIVTLSRPAASITTVTELFVDPFGTDPVTLDTSDYRVWFGGRVLERLPTGTHSRWAWGFPVWGSRGWGALITVEYVPVDTTAQRKMVAIDLAKLAIQYNAQFTEQVGDYSAQALDYERECNRILGRLLPAAALRFA